MRFGYNFLQEGHVKEKYKPGKLIKQEADEIKKRLGKLEKAFQSLERGELSNLSEEANFKENNL